MDVDLPRAPVVHVWRASLDAPEDDAVLSAADRAYADEAVNPDTRRRRRVARATLRRTLAAYDGRDPAALAFEEGEHGKPALAGGAVRFNLTHTGALFLVAVSADREVGIDAEAPRPRRDVLALSRHALTGADREALAAAPEAERHALFHRLWVRREAAVKCVGTGLAAGPEHPDVTVVDATIDAIPVAIAAAGPGPLELRWLPEED